MPDITYIQMFNITSSYRSFHETNWYLATALHLKTRVFLEYWYEKMSCKQMFRFKWLSHWFGGRNDINFIIMNYNSQAAPTHCTHVSLCDTITESNRQQLIFPEIAEICIVPFGSTGQLLNSEWKVKQTPLTGGIIWKNLHLCPT